jgi:hypothetical protein
MTNVVPEAPPPANRGLWMLVIGLGIAIIVVLALMIGMAIKQAVFDKPAEGTVASLKPGDVPELNLDLPAGATVSETRLDGANLVVRISGAEAEEILIIDPAKSKVLSRIRLNKKPAP